MDVKILLLGHTGMLGHMVKFFLEKNNYKLSFIDERWPNDSFITEIKKFRGDYIINCVGAIHQKTNIFNLNYELPEFLDKNTNCKIIHPGTDCEIDNDGYGKSKKKARDYITSQGNNTKIIKTSIIGPEIKSKASLLEWFLSVPDGSSITGYAKCYWNGNTTLEWAKTCLDMILFWEKYSTETIIQTECISKFELLNIIKYVFDKDITIEESSIPILNKCLIGTRKDDIKKQLIELKNFYYKNENY